MKKFVFCAVTAVAIEFFAMHAMDEQPQPVPAQAAQTAGESERSDSMNSPMHDEHVRRSVFQPSEHYTGEGPKYTMYTADNTQPSSAYQQQVQQGRVLTRGEYAKDLLEEEKAALALYKARNTPIYISSGSVDYSEYTAATLNNSVLYKESPYDTFENGIVIVRGNASGVGNSGEQTGSVETKEEKTFMLVSSSSSTKI